MDKGSTVQAITPSSTPSRSPMHKRQGTSGHAELHRPSHRHGRRVNATAMKASALRAERYLKAEARLVQSLRCSENGPSVQDLQLRTLKQATQMLAGFAEESGHQAKHLLSVTSSRADLADLDPDVYRSMMSQRWKAQRQRDFITENIKTLQQTITSLATKPPGPRDAVLLGGNEGQVLRPKDRSYTNLVSFLSCPQRVASLHRRSRPSLFKHHQPSLFLNPPDMPKIPTHSIPTPMQSTTTDSSSDMSLYMEVQTPIVADSLAEQQSHFTIQNEDVGTALILTQPLPAPVPPDPSKLEIELPDYVHELLADFDAQGHDLNPAETSLKFQPGENVRDKTRKGGLWPFRARSKSRGPRTSASQPDLRPMSSFKKLGGLMSASEVLSSRKQVNPRRGESRLTLTSVSELGSRGETESPTFSASSSKKVIGKVTSRIFRRISRINLRV